MPHRGSRALMPAINLAPITELSSVSQTPCRRGHKDPKFQEACSQENSKPTAYYDSITHHQHYSALR